uniref:sulfatase-like hydrolase/transferase n=1 Tax=Phocaeicola vulgatus TaxID=821 RepID=UPI004028DC59
MKRDIFQELCYPAILSIIYGLAFISFDFLGSSFSSVKDILLLILQWGGCVFATYGLILLLYVNKYVFSITFPLLILISTILTYFKITVNVSLTASVIDLVIVNDLKTSIAVISLRLIFFIIISIVLSGFIVNLRFKRVPLHHWKLMLFLSVIITLLTNGPTKIQYPLSYRQPFNIFYSIKDYLHNKRDISKIRPIFKGSAESNDKDVTIVFILGESLRSKNLPANGYSRNTTPEMLKKHNVVWIKNVYSPYGVTHTSVPYLFTRADEFHKDRAYKERSFISLFKQAKFRTFWISNQDPDPTFVYFINEADSLLFVNEGKTIFSLGSWYDTDIITPFKNLVNSYQGNKLFVLHTIGSHWYYPSHYPKSFSTYKPEVNSKVISSNTYNQMRNSYDNTILFSDYFWSQITNILNNKNAIVLYLSDHAECMGEDGQFTHNGNDKPALHYPACWVWYSTKYKASHPNKIDNLRRNRLKRFDSAFLFHSILDAGDINTKYLIPQYSIFRSINFKHD